MLEAEGHDLWMPSKLKGFLPEEGAGLTLQGVQNLRTLTRGQLDFHSVTRALRQMEAGGTERLLPGRGGPGATMATSSEDLGPGASESGGAFQSRLSPAPGRSEGGADDVEDEADYYDDEDDLESDQGPDEAALLAEIDGMDITEYQVEEALPASLRPGPTTARGNRTKSWNRQLERTEQTSA